MTPLQKLIQDLKIHKDQAIRREKCTTEGISSEEYYKGKAEAYTYTISFAELMLEKEKEVMCDFADKYRDDSCYATIQGGVSSEETTEEFFNKTFKTKEK